MTQDINKNTQPPSNSNQSLVKQTNTQDQGKPVISEQDILDAFDNAYFEILYQPQMSVQSEGQVVGAEAFVRIAHPEHGKIGAGQFIELVTHMDLMPKLTELVMEQVAKDLSAWQRAGNDLRVSINIHHSIFEDLNIIDRFDHILTSQGISKNRITLEISQTGEAKLTKQMCDHITKLRIKGFRISLDDFGFSLRVEDQLKNLPIDEIKIDRSVIKTLSYAVDAEKTVKRAIHIANSLGMLVVAVGVEKEHDLSELTRLGCDVAQGYFLGMPMRSAVFSQQILENSHIFPIEQVREQLNLLIIEDDEQQRELLSDILSEIFKLHTASNVQEARNLYHSVKPDLLIIDVQLPDGSGIDFCRQLNEEYSSDNFSALFVSGNDTLQNRLNAYEAGGADFICKPFLMPELVAKLGRLAIQQSKRQRISSESEEFQQVAMQSMQEVAHYGDIIQFYKKLSSCRDEKSLSKALFNTMGLKGLKTSVQFNCGQTITTFDQNSSVCSPIEMNIFELLRSKGRLYDFGKRTIVNDQHTSILIKNMPDDPESHGRIRDYAAVMIEGMEARYRDILRSKLIKSVFVQLKQLTQEMAVALQADKTRQSAALDHFSVELSMSFHALDLTEQQEEHISAIVENMLNAKDDNEQSRVHIDERINNILNEVEAMIVDLDAHNQPSIYAQKLPAEKSNEVELF